MSLVTVITDDALSAPGLSRDGDRMDTKARGALPR